MWVSPRDSFINNATLERPNTIGVHPNEWSTLQGYYITYTKRFMSPGGLSSHIYDVGKLYFIDYTLRIILYTDASDYAHVAYLCQLRPLPNEGVVEEPIRFLGGYISWRPDTLVNHQKRCIRHLLGTSSSR
jgi:hypothetical protein